MIARAYRFHGYGSLRGVYRRGQTVRGPVLSLRFERRDPERAYRLAVVVSRKVHKSAVVRNRIRRRIYEIVRQQPPKLLAGYDMVFTVFSAELADMEQSQLEQNVKSLLRKATNYHQQPATPSSPEARGIVKGN